MLKKSTSKAIDMMRKMPRTLVSIPTTPYEQLDGLIYDQLNRELHTYPKKNPKIARFAWVLGGYLGLHRFYMGQTGYGLLMLCTAGGLFVWWIIDGFKLNKMVATHNLDQAFREENNLSPIGMDHVPTAAPDALTDYPAWGKKRLITEEGIKRKTRPLAEYFWDAIALAFFGMLLGAFTRDSGYNSAAWAALAIVLMINFVDKLIPMHQLPIVRGLIRWDYRLRLFYQFNEPGRRGTLYFRPLVAFFYAPFKQKARTEVLLYLELGSIFIAGRMLTGIFFGDTFAMITAFDIGGFMENWLKGIVMGFFSVYGFTAPIGAILMKHVLLRRPNFVRWGLSIVIIFFLIMGYSSS